MGGGTEESVTSWGGGRIVDFPTPMPVVGDVDDAEGGVVADKGEEGAVGGPPAGPHPGSSGDLGDEGPELAEGLPGVAGRRRVGGGSWSDQRSMTQLTRAEIMGEHDGA